MLELLKKDWLLHKLKEDIETIDAIQFATGVDCSELFREGDIRNRTKVVPFYFLTSNTNIYTCHWLSLDEPC